MNRVFFIALLVSMLAATHLYGEDRALLIGIDKYKDVGPTLQGAENDVGRINTFVRNSLKFRPDQIKVLLNEEATKKNILQSMSQWLVADSHPGDRVFFFYSGHGFFQADKDGDESDSLDETLVNYDTKVDDQNVVYNMITDDEIDAILKKLTDRKVVVMIDSCHSGTMTRDLEADNGPNFAKTIVLPDRKPQVFSKGQFRSIRKEGSFVTGSSSRVVWSAVTASQRAFENVELSPRSGVFTHAFLNGLEKGLADLNKNGVITHSELLDYIQNESDAFCSRHLGHCKDGLTPTLEAGTSALASPVFSTWGYQSQDTERPPQDSPAGQLSGPDQAADILAHTNEADIQLDIFPSTRFTLGEKMQFSVTSPTDGYLVVLDINADNEVTQLFPNRFSDKAGKNNRIVAGQPVSIPNSYYGFELTAGKPVGDGMLMAIVTEDPVQLNDLLAKNKDLEIVENAKEYLTNLSSRLRDVWRSDPHNRKVKWSLAEKKYTISQ